jgi:tripartite-type tricarboxylate transporter receptor subunit TctC
LSAGAAATAPADGYTVITLDFGTYVLNPHLYSKVPYNPTRDFKMVGMMVTVPLVLFVNPKVPSGNLGEFIAYVKSQPPGSINYGSAGVGSAIHLAMELFQQRAGIRLTHVPYKGTPAVLSDVVAGQVSAFFSDPNTAMPHVAQGRLKALAVAMPKRLEAYPDLPTMKEAGQDVEVPLWLGLGVPSATPAPVIERLSGALTVALREPEVVKRFKAVGIDVTPALSEPANAFASQQLAAWGEFLKPMNIRLD